MPPWFLLSPGTYVHLILSADEQHRSSWPAHLPRLPELSARFRGPFKSKVFPTPGVPSPFKNLREITLEYPPTTHVHALPDINISVRQYLSSGRVNAGFAAKAHNTPLVVKFTYPRRPLDFGETKNEAYIYHHNLWHLQGTIVPEWYGVWMSTQHDGEVGTRHILVLCSILEDVGEALTLDDVRFLSIEEKNIIVNKYRCLHAAGVVHNSASPKHWVRHGRMPIDTVRLIDFGLSLHVPVTGDGSPMADPGFKTEAENEIAAVCDALGLDEDDLEPDPAAAGQTTPPPTPTP